MPLDLQHILALAIIGLLFIALLKEWLEPDMAAWTAVIIILALGLLPMSKALAALANPAPVTVACMFILGSALERTGVVAVIGHSLGRFGGKSELGLLLVFCVFACGVSAFLNNTAVVAVLMPVAVGLAKHARISPSKLLLPLSYAAILGGTCTLIGTSTNLAVQGVLRDKGEPLLSMFEFSKLGVIYAAIGITYLALVGRKLLPDHGLEPESNPDLSLPALTQFVVTPESPLIGQTLVGTLLKRFPGLDVLEVRRRGVPLQERLDALGIRAGDRLLLTESETGSGHQDALKAVATAMGLESLESREHGSVEAIVGSDSNLIDTEIGAARFRQRFAVRVSKVVRDGETLSGDLGQVTLCAGDQIHLSGPTEGLQRLMAETELVKVQTNAPLPRLDRAGWIASGIFAAFVLGSSFHDLWPIIFKLPTEGMAIACVLALVLTRSLEHKELYQCVNWSIVFLISGMLIVGAMLEHTGTASMMAETMAHYLQGAPGWVVLSITYLGAMVLTELISNNAVAAMMTPVVIHLAHQLHLSPRPLIIAVIFAASASFSTPVGYQTNTFIYGAGGYRFTDFFRVGVPLNLTLWVVATILIPYFWPL